jgi:hypothetical protein
MPDDDPFYFGDPLKEPVPSPAMAQLLTVLGRFECHPTIQEGVSRRHQLWVIHRALYEQPEDTITLLAEHYRDRSDDPDTYIPHPCAVENLAERIYKAWLALAKLGFNVLRQDEPTNDPGLPFDD